MVTLRDGDKNLVVVTKTKGSLLLPTIVLVAAAMVVVPPLREQTLGLLDGLTGGTELVGTGETRFMVASSASSEVAACTPYQGLVDEQCDDLKFVIFDAARMPFITRNISTAWEAGKPGVLTKDSVAEVANRKEVCLPSFPRLHGGECDEFPFGVSRTQREGPV